MDGVVRLYLTPEDRAHLAALGVLEKDGVLQSESGREVSAGTAAALLQKVAGEGYPDVAVTFAPMPPPEVFDRGRLVAGHAAENATDWIVGVPPGPPPGTAARARAEHERPEAFREAYKGKKKPGRHKSRGREAEQAAYDERPRSHVETVKATVPRPDEFGRGYLAAGHQAESPAVTGVRGTTPVPAENPRVAGARDFDRPWLTRDHQQPSPGDEEDNSPVPPGSPGFEVYDAGEAAYRSNQSAVTTHHVQQSAVISSEPAPAQWSPSPGLGAASMPHPVSTGGLPIAKAPGE